ncbi:diacylglycerol/lipid kinase family protein [Blastopirellula retiformator]|uniref:Diacylglycerol kinase n=1 Tax=Blastopirellula retiformator TaxID=2527970 RepID=A0A5C5VNU4_9BACT|nr:acylglycerol kinase family protein [Blastopirellula retiformator]TWT39595.1 Diacylglycerol kinase [Blastopirellula retiformator]
MRRYVVIWNRNARQGAAAAEAKAELTALAGANFHETESFEQACCILDDVRDEDLVIVAGGDGGINGIVNRVQSCCQSRPTLAIVSLGAGNDFVRSLGIHPDPLSTIAAIRLGRTVGGGAEVAPRARITRSNRSPR